MLLLMVSLAYGWFSNQRTTLTLADGTVVFCDGVLKGKRVNDTEFEPDLYAYPKDGFLPITERMGARIRRLVHFWKTLSFVRIMGRAEDDSVVEIDPTLPPLGTNRDNYWVTRQRFWPAGSDSCSLTKDLHFMAGLKIPPEIRNFDLHVALEEMQVFEFFVKVSN